MKCLTFVPFGCSWALINKLHANLKWDSNKYCTINFPHLMFKGGCDWPNIWQWWENESAWVTFTSSIDCCDEQWCPTLDVMYTLIKSEKGLCCSNDGHVVGEVNSVVLINISHTLSVPSDVDRAYLGMLNCYILRWRWAICVCMYMSLHGPGMIVKKVVITIYY